MCLYQGRPGKPCFDSRSSSVWRSAVFNEEPGTYPVPVLDDDDEHTLADRILEQEHRLYAEAVRFILSGDWHIDDRRVLAGKE